MAKLHLLCLAFIGTTVAYAQKTTTIWLDGLSIKSFSEGIPAVLPKTNAAGDSMRINRRYFNHGVGVNATSILAFYLDEKATEFTALVGVDDKGNRDLPHTFYVVADRKILFDSGEMRLGDAPKPVTVKLTGVKRLGLLVKVDDDGRTKVYSNWANAQLVMLDNHLPENIPNSDEKYILTPASPKTPRINSATVFGATPANPFLYTIAVTGDRPMQFSARGLPKGLSIDENTGIITGKVAERGTYVATLNAKMHSVKPRKS
jgi:alpha-galactosidase